MVWKEECAVNDKEFQEEMNVTFGIPKEFREELPGQETVYDWNGGVLYETEQNA